MNVAIHSNYPRGLVTIKVVDESRNTCMICWANHTQVQV